MSYAILFMAFVFAFACGRSAALGGLNEDRGYYQLAATYRGDAWFYGLCAAACAAWGQFRW